MKEKHRRRRKGFRLFTPGMFLLLAVLFAVAFGLCHFLGFKEDVAVLFATTRGGTEANIFSAIIYVMLYLCFVLVVPILLIGAAVFCALEFAVARIRKKER
ncbi:MAG: hypothetical protein QGD94_06280 [Planctomycetia bacterium]|nr:hypothetical protein [Planctomycetia bacterium]